MMVNGHDPLTAALRGLGEEPGRDLTELVFAGWVRASAPTFGDVYTAFTDEGVSYVRTAESMHDDDAEFKNAFRQRFGRPLRKADRPPSGLLPALRGKPSPKLAFDLRELSEFERDVLTATGRIPAGQTRPYGWVAWEIGRPKAVRAVGSALARNPVPLLIPCHRVTRADGDPGEYVFGPQAKERWLRAEGVNLDEVRDLAESRVFYIGSDTTNIVCFPTCSNARRITPEHRRGFRAVADAQQAGYRPCRHCRPAAVAA